PATETYTLSLHDALPISTSSSDRSHLPAGGPSGAPRPLCLAPSPVCTGQSVEEHGLRDVDRQQYCDKMLALPLGTAPSRCPGGRSEEHTSELQSRSDLVC